MKRETAAKIVDAANRIDDILEELGKISWEIEDDSERKEIRRAIVSCIIILYEKITREAVKDFPDLHPDRDQKQRGDPD
jgi:hypothetical protein